jgi:chromate transporter
MMELFMLFWVFLRVGLLGFGGGYAMLPLIFQGVEQFDIIGVEEFANLAAISQITPGPISINAATWVGFQAAGLPGALLATFAVTLPSIVLTTLACRFLEKFKNSATIGAIMSGVRPVTVGLIGAAAVFIAEPSLFNDTLSLDNIGYYGWQFFNPIPLLIFGATVLFYGKWKVHPILILLVAGGLGAAFLS